MALALFIEVGCTKGDSAGIAGSIVNARDGKPVVAATVVGGGTLTKTDDHGRFRIGASPPISLRIARCGYVSARRTVTSSGPQIALDPETIRGRVIDARTAKGVEATLFFLPDGGKSVTASNGKALLEGAPICARRVRVEAKGYDSLTVPLRDSRFVARVRPSK